MKKKVWTLIVAALIAVTASLIAGGVFALETGDEYSGDDLSAQDKAFDVHWEFNPDTGHLSITGTGPMATRAVSDSSLATRPWHKFASQITSVSVGEGITSIGGSAFAKFTNLTEVEIADTVTYIGYHAFSGCYNLKTIDLPDSLTSLSNHVFNGCSRLDNVVLPPNLNVMWDNVFDACYALKHLYIRSPQMVKKIESKYDYLSNKIVNLDNIYFESSLASSVPQYIKDGKPYTSILVHDGVGYTQYSENEPSEYTLRGYIQLCPGGDTYDMRFLVEGDSEYLTHYTTATVTLTFTKNGDPTQTKTMKAVANQAYTSVLANGEKHPARDGYGFVGLVIEDIGKNDVAALSASVTLTAANGDWVQYELGSVKDVLSHLQDPAA